MGSSRLICSFIGSSKLHPSYHVPLSSGVGAACLVVPQNWPPSHPGDGEEPHTSEERAVLSDALFYCRDFHWDC
ncbi:unnamed protein product [Boreogadus saida]